MRNFDTKTIDVTPKDKAKELVNKMYGSNIKDFDTLYIKHPYEYALAKDCALICIDEMLKNCYYNSDYWKFVRIEIELL